jgi:uncharacterized membrane protein
VSAPRTLLWLGIAAYAGGFALLASMWHRAFSSGRFDLGNMVQAVWSTANGHPLEITNLSGEQVSRLAAHADLVLVAFAPLWPLWPSPELLLTAQAVALSLGALPVFWLARKHLGSDWAAAAFAFAYLLYPPVQWLALDDFHAVALACPLLLFAFWYLDEDRLSPFAGCSLLAALTREEIGLVVAAMGLWYVLARGRVGAGVAIAVAGVGMTTVMVGVVIPHFDGAEPSFYGRYDEVGGSPSGVARTAFTDPLHLLAVAFDAPGVSYLAALILPLAGLSLLSPPALLVAAPELVLNLLSSTATQTSIRFHYSAAVAAPLVAGAILGAARLPPRLAWPTAVSAAIAALVGNYVLGPLPLWRALPGGDGIPIRELRVSDHDRIARRALQAIPDRPVVSATNSLGAHLSARRRILSFPHIQDAEWVAVDRTRPGYADRIAPAATSARLRALRRDPGWSLVFGRDGVFVFRRRP